MQLSPRSLRGDIDAVARRKLGADSAVAPQGRARLLSKGTVRWKNVNKLHASFHNNSLSLSFIFDLLITRPLRTSLLGANLYAVGWRYAHGRLNQAAIPSFLCCCFRIVPPNERSMSSWNDSFAHEGFCTAAPVCLLFESREISRFVVPSLSARCTKFITRQRHSLP